MYRLTWRNGGTFAARARVTTMTIALVLLSVSVGCSHLTDVPDPTTIVDPHIVQTQDGAVGLYRSAITNFASAFAGFPIDGRPYIGGDAGGQSFVIADALAGDQLVAGSGDAGQPNNLYNVRRVDGTVADLSGQIADLMDPYGRMHQARLEIDVAVGTLRQYGTTTPPSYVGELIALRGYLYVMFSEMYCSGVPFSRAVYGGDIVLGAGESTTEMLQHAIVQFDSAIAIATDSLRIRQLAMVGKARALVDLGQFTDAAAIASQANVPTTFVYAMQYGTTFPNYLGGITDGGAGGSDIGSNPPEVYVANRLGNVGLDYLSAGDTTGGRTGDPRVYWFPVGGIDYEGLPVTPEPIPAKFPTGSTPVPVASGIEARLIEAEAALSTHDVTTWANILNDLRANAITPAIPPLTDDSTVTASDVLQQNVMFRERAFWLYGEGHRLGDLRRLVRQYHRTVTSVFPQGPHPTVTQPYLGAGLRTFSTQTNFVPPRSEQQTNPNYHGCLNRDA